MSTFCRLLNNMINAMVTSNPTQRIYPQRIYPPDPPIETKRINYDPVLGLCNSTQRNLSARSSIKTKRINYGPVLKLYYYKSIWEPDPRTKKRTTTTLQESMGARGVQPLDANFDKSFVTPVWNFVVVSPGSISSNSSG